jgi:hypothetical protein
MLNRFSEQIQLLLFSEHFQAIEFSRTYDSCFRHGKIFDSGPYPQFWGRKCHGFGLFANRVLWLPLVILLCFPVQIFINIMYSIVLKFNRFSYSVIFCNKLKMCQKPLKVNINDALS